MNATENTSVIYEEIIPCQRYDPNDSFSKFIKKKQNDLNSLSSSDREHVYSTKALAKLCQIDYESFRKIINKQRTTPNRDLIIYLCFVMFLCIDDANHALELYGATKLTEQYQRDNEIMKLLKTNNDMLKYACNKHRIEDIKSTLHELNEAISLEEINRQLKDKGFYPLNIHNKKMDVKAELISNYNKEQLQPNIVSTRNIIDSTKHTPNTKKHNTSINVQENVVKDTVEFPCSFIEKRIKWKIDDLFYDQYGSLITKFNPDVYNIEASLLLKEGVNGKCKLVADSRGNHFRYNYPSLKIKEYKNINKSKKYRHWFADLDQLILNKKREFLLRLNDTRNYQERISARIISNQIHVFYETYNYTVPELGEYFFMDYNNGVYTLYISNSSHFMKYYLSEEEYFEFYGKLIISSNEKYSSSKEIDDAINNAPRQKADILKLHLKAYNNIKERIDTLINKLKMGKAHIHNLEMIYDNEYEVLNYYKVTEEFDFKFNSKDGEIEKVGIDKATFTLTDNTQVELTINDLINGFKLGLSSVEEIGKFLLEHKSLIINNLL